MPVPMTWTIAMPRFSNCAGATSRIDSSAVTDPVGPASASKRVVRGGGWNSYAKDCRSAKAISLPPGGVDRTILTGFRLVFLP